MPRGGALVPGGAVSEESVAFDERPWLACSGDWEAAPATSEVTSHRLRRGGDEAVYNSPLVLAGLGGRCGASRLSLGALSVYLLFEEERRVLWFVRL